MLDEEVGQIRMALSDRPMERCRPVVALGRYIGTVFDEKPGQIYMTTLRRPM